MSLINQMLKDLEERKQKEQASSPEVSKKSEPAKDIQAVSQPPERKGSHVVAVIILACFLIAGGYWWAGEVLESPPSPAKESPLITGHDNSVSPAAKKDAAATTGNLSDKKAVSEKNVATVVLHSQEIKDYDRAAKSMGKDDGMAKKKKTLLNSAKAETKKGNAASVATSKVQATPKAKMDSNQSVPLNVGTELQNLRIREFPDHLDVLADFDGIPTYRILRKGKGNEFHVELKETYPANKLASLPPPTSFLDNVKLEKSKNALRLVLQLKPQYTYRDFHRDFALNPAQGTGHRLAFEIYPVIPPKAAASPPVEKTRSEKTTKIAPSQHVPKTNQGQITKVLNPASPRQQAEWAYERGQKALLYNRFEEGERAFRQALAYNPGHLAARKSLAAQLIKTGHINEASALLADGLQTHPDYNPFKKSYARILVNKGDLQNALRILLEGTVPGVQDDLEYQALLAAIYQRLGQYAKAAQTYQKIISRQPHLGTWWMGLGIALEDNGQNTEAAEAYKKALGSGTLRAELSSFIQQRLAEL